MRRLERGALALRIGDARLVVCALGVALLLLGWAASQASAAQLWRIDSLSATTAAPGSILRYTVEARNVGDVPTDGSPTTLHVTLPDDITAVGASVVHSSAFGYSCTAEDGVSPVAGESRLICTTAAPLEVQRTDTLNLAAVVDPGAAPGMRTAVFEMSGGGAPSASTADPTLIGGPPAFGVEAFDTLVTRDAARTPSTQAGEHPYAISTSIDFNSFDNLEPLVNGPYPVEAPKDVLVDLPPGLVGNPTGVAQCTLSQLGNSSGTIGLPLCPPASQVGTSVIRFANPSGLSFFGPVAVYNITPPADVPARFGFNVLSTIVVIDAEVRSGGDYGLTVGARNAPEGVGLVGTTVTFWGVPSDSSHDLERACSGGGPPGLQGAHCTSGAPAQAFLRNPTSCPDPGVGLPWVVRTDSWAHPGVFKEASFRSHDPLGYPWLPAQWGPEHGPDGCARVPFDPKLVGGP